MRIELTMKRIGTIAAAVLMGVSAMATPVLFSVHDDQDVPVTGQMQIRPKNNPLEQGTNIIAGPNIVTNLVAGLVTVNLVPNDYTVAVAGVAKLFSISVYDTNVVVNATDLNGDLQTYVYTNLSATLIPVSKLSHAGATSGQVVTYNGSAVVWADATGGGGGATNVIDLASTESIAIGTNSSTLRTPHIKTNVVQILAAAEALKATNNFNGAWIRSGTVPPVRLGTGSGGATKFLREDSTWQSVAGGGGGGDAFLGNDQIWTGSNYFNGPVRFHQGFISDGSGLTTMSNVLATGWLGITNWGKGVTTFRTDNSTNLTVTLSGGGGTALTLTRQGDLYADRDIDAGQGAFHVDGLTGDGSFLGTVTAPTFAGNFAGNFAGDGSMITNSPLPSGTTTPEVWGGAGDLVQLSTVSIASGNVSLTCSAANFTFADIGKSVVLYLDTTNMAYIKTGISNVTSPTTITLSNASTKTWSSNGRMLYGTDNTAALRQAFNWCYTNVPQGGLIQFEAKAYLLAGNIVTNNSSGSVDASLLCPTSDSINSAYPTYEIVMRGAYRRRPEDSALSGPSSWGGTVLFNSSRLPATVSSNGWYSVISLRNQTIGWGLASLMMENIDFKQPVQPQLTWICNVYGSGLDIRDCVFDVDFPAGFVGTSGQCWYVPATGLMAGSAWNSPYVGSNTVARAVVFPGGFNTGDSRFLNSYVFGYPVGLQILAGHSFLLYSQAQWNHEGIFFGRQPSQQAAEPGENFSSEAKGMACHLLGNTFQMASGVTNANDVVKLDYHDFVMESYATNIVGFANLLFPTVEQLHDPFQRVRGYFSSVGMIGYPDDGPNIGRLTNANPLLMTYDLTDCQLHVPGLAVAQGGSNQMHSFNYEASNQYDIRSGGYNRSGANPDYGAGLFAFYNTPYANQICDYTNCMLFFGGNYTVIPTGIGDVFMGGIGDKASLRVYNNGAGATNGGVFIGRQANSSDPGKGWLRMEGGLYWGNYEGSVGFGGAQGGVHTYPGDHNSMGIWLMSGATDTANNFWVHTDGSANMTYNAPSATAQHYFYSGNSVVDCIMDPVKGLEVVADIQADKAIDILTNALSTWPTAPRARGASAIVSSNGYPYILLSTNGGVGSASWTGTNKLGW
jgi:hypothetical protein